MISFLRTQRVHVKPAGDGWITWRGNTMDNFVNDWRCFGLDVAVYNIVWLWRTRREENAGDVPASYDVLVNDD